ncbi:Uncharacterised protein [uncultured archaeon]|nr:Uncharacterised protein [uncultured archaeon]
MKRSRRASGGGQKRRLWEYVVLILLLGAVFYAHPFGEQEFGGGFRVCLDFIQKGEGLYNLQPYCSQTPFIYYYGYIIRQIIGDSLLDFVLAATTLVADAVAYVVLRRVLEAEKLPSGFLYDAAFILFMVTPSVNQLPSAAAAAAVAAATYVLLYGKSRRRFLVGGVLFSVATFSKYTAAVPCVGLGLFCLFSGGHVKVKRNYPFFVVSDEGRFSFVFSRLLLPTLILFIFLRMVYPHFLEYTLLAHVYRAQLTSWQAVLEMLIMYRNAVPAVLYAAAVFYAVKEGALRSRRLMYAVVSAAGLLLLMYSFTRATGMFTPPIYYALPYLPFIVVTLAAVQVKYPKMHVLLFILLIVYPTLQVSPVDKYLHRDESADLQKFRALADWGFHFIPPQNGRVLIEVSDDDYLDTFFATFNITTVDRNQIDTISPKQSVGHEDPVWAPNLRRLLGIQSTDDNIELTDAEKDIRKKLLNGTYSLVIYGPPSWTSVIRILEEVEKDGLYSTTDQMHVLLGIKNEPVSYCVAITPNSYYGGTGRSDSTLFFREDEQCQKFLNDGLMYYGGHFNEICAESKKIAGLIHDMYWRIRPDMYFPTCPSGGKREVWLSKDTRLMEGRDVALVLAASIALYFAVHYGGGSLRFKTPP